MVGIPINSRLTNKEKVEFLTRENAYFIWENRVRNNIPGNDVSDWLEAEKLVKEDFSLLFYNPIGCLTHKIRLNRNGKYVCSECSLELGTNLPPGEMKCPRCQEVLEIIATPEKNGVP